MHHKLKFSKTTIDEIIRNIDKAYDIKSKRRFKVVSKFKFSLFSFKIDSIQKNIPIYLSTIIQCKNGFIDVIGSSESSQYISLKNFKLHKNCETSLGISSDSKKPIESYTSFDHNFNTLKLNHKLYLTVLKFPFDRNDIYGKYRISVGTLLNKHNFSTFLNLKKKKIKFEYGVNAYGNHNFNIIYSDPLKFDINHVSTFFCRKFDILLGFRAFSSMKLSVKYNIAQNSKIGILFDGYYNKSEKNSFKVMFEHRSNGHGLKLIGLANKSAMIKYDISYKNFLDISFTGKITKSFDDVNTGATITFKNV